MDYKVWTVEFQDFAPKDKFIKVNSCNIIFTNAKCG